MLCLIVHIDIIALPVLFFNGFAPICPIRVAVRVCNSVSSYKPFSCGVPQGSVLGPRLFSLYIHPIRFILSSYDVCYIVYADDMTVFLGSYPQK